jgi:hypothetical protein
VKRVLLAVACVALLSALSPGLARAHVIEEGMYDLWYTDDQGVMTKYVEVKERVYDWTQTEELTGFSQAYLYSYTVLNDMFDNPGIWCWGFMDDPRSWGAQVLGWTGPSGWYPGESYPGPPWNTWTQAGREWTLTPWDCACSSGGDAGWTGTATATYTWIEKGDSLDTFWLVAKNPPLKMVEAFAHDGDPVGSCGGKFAYGEISAPTPEPVTMALLALGLPAGILLRRRHKEE